jgi:spore coat polysaccharide biosynthesis predicted glycosyltransferase SpsG
VALVVGPYEQPEAPPGVELVVAPPSLRSELMQADLVISAAGQTMLEAVAVGTPCVALPLFDNQRRNAMLLEKRGAVLVVDSSGVALGRVVTDLAEDAARRREMARRSQEAVDGYGAHRIAFEIERLLEMPGAPG